MGIIVNIQEHAFQAILIGAIETFPSYYFPSNGDKSKSLKGNTFDGESMGLLFGQRILKKESIVYNVSLAVTMQATKRKANSVEYSPPHFDRIRDISESFPQLEFLGAFHSHPWLKQEFGQSSTIPSETDELSTLNEAQRYGDDLLEIILGITALSRNSYRIAKIDTNSIDSFCGQFKYRLSAYCTLGMASSDEEAQESESEQGLFPVDQLICPIAAHGGGLFAG